MTTDFDPTTSRRRFLRTVGLTAGGLALAAGTTGSAAALPGKPSFAERLYGDGETWGTKGAAIIPGPTDKNAQSFDKLFAIVNSNNPAGQLPVAEAAPGNPAYNGGRWYTHTVEWTQSGFDAHGTVPVLKSYDDVMLHYGLGHLDITPGSPDPSSTPDFFECPMLPVKDA
jgi:hypothetical protein